MVHQKVGHLGIFVSGSVARKEHRQILGNLGWLEYLQPGLYEMVIDEPPSNPKQEDWRVRFVERDMKDIFKPEDSFADNHAFEKVYKVSRLNDAMYSLFLRPWIRLTMNEPQADMIGRLHPLRMQRYLISDMNPLLEPVKMLAEQVKINRYPAAENNPFAAMEEICSKTLEFNFNLFRDFRDRTHEYLFKSFYDNPFTTSIFGDNKPGSEVAVQVAEKNDGDRETEKIRLRILAEKGGFIEACIRVMAAVAGRDKIIDVREFQVVEQIIQSNKKLKILTPGEFKVIALEQSNILAVVPQQAIRALRHMPLSQQERSELIRIAEMVAKADGKAIGKNEKKILTSLRQVLQKKDKAPIKPAKNALI
jgi:tellurite resistance protein